MEYIIKSYCSCGGDVWILTNMETNSHTNKKENVNVLLMSYVILTLAWSVTLCIVSLSVYISVILLKMTIDVLKNRIDFKTFGKK